MEEDVMGSLVEKNRRSIRLLLVEDNLGDVYLIKEIFKASKRRIVVSRVRDGEEAVDFLRRRGKFQEAERPDLVLLDLNIPKKNGHEVLAEIKGDPDLSMIPVIVLTNSDLNEDVKKAYESRANFYLVKPSNLDQLFVAMRYIEDIWLRGVLEEDD
jgi:CheY-like chemotaxis protein